MLTLQIFASIFNPLCVHMIHVIDLFVQIDLCSSGVLFKAFCILLCRFHASMTEV